MKCVKCGSDAKKKYRVSGLCPICKHPFVTDPEVDGLTDMMLRNAENAVSGNGTFFFLPEQLEYQLLRSCRKRNQFTGLGSIVLVVLLFFVTLILGVGIHPGFFILSVAGVIAAVAIMSSSFGSNVTLYHLRYVVQKWIVVNPHAKLIRDKEYTFNSKNSHLEEVSFDRVLVCDKDATVNFFLENLFHFHYSCPVLGGNGYPQGIYEDMLQRLKGNPNLRVFLLHDYSTAGLAFVSKMRSDPKWFGDKNYQIVDLGLNVEQKEKLFKHMTINQESRSPNNIQETAEIAMFKPATLIMLCGAAINEEVALDQVLPVAEGRQDSGGGYG